MSPGVQVYTWDRQRGRHLRSPSQATLFYKRLPSGIWVQTNDGSDPNVMLKIPGYPFPLTQAQYGQILNPPPVMTLPIREGNFTINATVTAQTIDPGYHYKAADPSKPLFTVNGSNLVGCQATPGKPIRMTSPDHFFFGYRNRLDVRYADMIGVNPNINGEVKGRAIKGEEILHLVFIGNRLDGTSGLELKGKGDAATAFAAYLGDRGSDEFRILFNDVLDIDGRVSSGTGTGNSHYRRGNVGGTHGNSDWRWNPAVPLAERTSANKLDPAKWAPNSWMPCQFVQFQKITQHPSIEVGWNRVINRPGRSRVEDNINQFGGSGGTQQNPARIHHNYVQWAGGWDWNFDPATSTVYDNSNRITLNVDGYNPPGNLTTYSGSITIIDGYNGGSWPDNAHWTEVTDNYGLGHQIQFHNASFVKVLRNRVYNLTHYSETIPFSYTYSGFFGQDFGVTANDNGTQRILASGSELRDNVFFTNGTGYGNTSGVVAANKSNNTFQPQLAAGGEAAVQAEWLQRAAASSVTIGIPSDRLAS